MLVYNKTFFDNFFLLRRAKKWFKSGFVSNEEFEKINKNHASPYKSFNIFARIGLFIFTVFILGSAVGLFNLVLSSAGMESHATFQCFFFGIIFYVLAEISIRKFNFFRAGIKGACIYASVYALCFGIASLINGNNYFFNSEDSSPLLVQVCIFPVILFAALRFSDMLLSFSALSCLLYINALAVLKMGTFGKLILPFECMAVSYLIYFIMGKIKNKEELHYWKSPMIIIETASLIAIYLSGNYMVVRKLSESLLNTVINPGEDIHLAVFFYAYTIIVPLVYVWIGLKRKNYTFLRCGVILEVAGILAIKYYHHIMPAETAMMLGGILMILLGYFSIKYLKTPKHGVTFEIYKRNNEEEEALLNVVSIAASKVMADQHAPHEQDGVKLGGGEGFGGGGAGADY